MCIILPWIQRSCWNTQRWRECHSSHPISKSLKKAYGKPLDPSRVTDVEEISGNGVTAKVDGVRVAAGNSKLMEKLGVDCMECHSVGTVVHMAVNGKYAGHILISDQIKPHAKEAIAALKKCGVKKTIMLTGDRREAARQVAEELGIDEVHSELLPGDKVAQVEKLLDEKGEKEKLAFVGDGINDAPGAFPCGYRHRNGSTGLGCSDRGGGYCSDG